MAITSIALAPAIVVAVIQFRSADWREVFGVVSGYLVFGAVGGAIAGFARPILSTLWGALLIGALIGALGVTALIYCGAPGARRDTGLLAFSAAIGACTGAACGAVKLARRRKRQV